jgi:hypothetical protein
MLALPCEPAGHGRISLAGDGRGRTDSGGDMHGRTTLGVVAAAERCAFGYAPSIIQMVRGCCIVIFLMRGQLLALDLSGINEYGSPMQHKEVKHER